MKKILFIIDESKIGGGQKHVLLLASTIDRKKYNVGVMCEGEGFLVEKLREINISVISNEMSNNFSIATLSQTIKLIKKFNPDIIHTHGGTAGFYGRIAGYLAGVHSIIHTYHGIHYIHGKLTFKKKIFLFLEQLLVRITDKCIFVCKNDERLGRTLSLTSDSKTEIVYNGIDIDLFSKSVTSNTIAKADFGTIGRLHEQKGQKYLLEAFAILKKKFPKIILRIVGDGELKSELNEQAKSLEIFDSVEFSGAKTNVNEQLQAIKFFVLPSLWEGLPLVMLEAMAAKIPVIATAVDGNVEIATNNEEALFVEPAHPLQLAKAMEEIYTNSNLCKKIADAAYKRVSTQFSIQEMTRKTVAIYDKL